MLYQMADIYISPYRAEGFNIPVLEAAACGVPVICTKGGPTDDFVADAFALRIESKKFRFPSEEQAMSQLEPNLEHLIALMTAVIQDKSWRGAAAAAAPAHVGRHYTWDIVVDALVQGLLH
jgi:glycosyltransferase involved in cell wall biosynthesis